jgi:methionyl-tRNA synthetase
MSKKHTYVTTTLPYVNSDPHVGFALEIVQADIFARYCAIRDGAENVFFNTGTDEHGVKVYRKAEELGRPTQEYVDENAEKFRKLKVALNLLPNIHFVRTSDPHHKAAAQEFWRRCAMPKSDQGDKCDDARSDIYKKNYRIKYCIGCELEKTDSELRDGKCPIHPNLPIEIIEEENYFFRFSRYQKQLLELYAKYHDFVVPNYRFNEIRAFVERGLEDFSISRLKSKMPWGVEVPGDSTQVMYVWFDALVSYISTLGWPESEKTTEFATWWGTAKAPNALQFAGKDNLRQQSAMWQAMLMSAGLPPSHQIVIHGFIHSDGQKMSKSLGNVIDPFAIVAEYGTDALRYYLAREIHPFEDSDFTMEKFKAAYNANLANGIGNLVSRLLKLTSGYQIKGTFSSPQDIWKDKNISIYRDFLENYELNKAADYIWLLISNVDQTIQKNQPFKKLKDPLRKEEGIRETLKLLSDLWQIAILLEPILPETSMTIRRLITDNKMPEKPLFTRLT